MEECVPDGAHESEGLLSPLVDTDAVRNRLGIEFRRERSPSMWLNLKRSTAPKSDGFRAWPPVLVLPGVGGPREAEEAIEEVDVAGEGGPLLILVGPSIAVTTLAGFLTRFDTLFRRACAFDGSERVCVNGVS